MWSCLTLWIDIAHKSEVITIYGFLHSTRSRFWESSLELPPTCWLFWILTLIYNHDQPKKACRNGKEVVRNDWLISVRGFHVQEMMWFCNLLWRTKAILLYTPEIINGLLHNTLVVNKLKNLLNKLGVQRLLSFLPSLPILWDVFWCLDLNHLGMGQPLLFCASKWAFASIKNKNKNKKGPCKQ